MFRNEGSVHWESATGERKTITFISPECCFFVGSPRSLHGRSFVLLALFGELIGRNFCAYFKFDDYTAV